MQRNPNRARRLAVKLLANTVLAGFAATASLAAHAQSVTINVVDVGASLALLQDANESYTTNKPNV